MRNALLNYNQTEADSVLSYCSSLGAGERKLADLFAVIYQDLSFYDIQLLLNNLKIELSRSPLIVLEEFTAKQVITKYRGGYRISTLIAEQLFEQMAERPDFARELTQILSKMPRINTEYRPLVQFRIALYTGNTTNQKQYGSDIFDRYPKNSVIPGALLFFSPFSKERFARVKDPEQRREIGRNAAMYCIIHGIPGEGTFLTELAHEFASLPESDPIVLTLSLFHYWSTSQSESFGDPRAESGLAMVKAVTAGDWFSAEKHLNLFRRNVDHEKPTIFIAGFTLFFETILYLKSDNRTRLDQLQTFLKFGRSLLSAEGSFEPLIELISVHLGKKSVRTVNASSLDPSQSFSLFGSFVRLFCGFWLDIPGHDERVDAFEYELRGQPVVPFFTDQLALMHRGEGLASALPRMERWMGTVTSLLELLRSEESTEKDERLYWKVEARENSVSIKPVLQKKGKNGQWSKGRIVTSKYDISLHFDTIDHCSRDRELLGCWETFESDRWNFDRRGRSETALLKQLIGHPRLYDMNTNTQVHVVEQPVVIAAELKNGTIAVTVKPGFPSMQGVTVVRSGDTIITAFATPQQREIAKLLEHGLNIPASQGARASELFTALGDTITVEGDAEVLGSDLPEFPGRAEPQFFIEPFETGVQFRLRAVPCDSALSFVPGRGKPEFVGLDSTETVLVKRNFDAEKAKSEELTDSIDLLREQFNPDFHWTVPDPLEALEVLEQIKNHPAKPVLNWPKGESLVIRKSISADSIFRSVERRQEWFELGGSIEIEKNLVLSLKALMALSKESESRFVRMQNGEYIALTKTLKQELDTLSALSAPAKGESVKLHPLALIAMSDSYIGEAFESSRQWIARFRENHEKVYALPKGLKVELRDYQRDGYQWLMRLGESQAGALLADDMGLGKTVQAIALLWARRSDGPALVIAPASLGFNWADEIRRFAPNLNAQILGLDNREEQIRALSEGDILITTYGLVQRNPELFTQFQWSTMILDEAQAVKNTSAKRTQIIKEIPRKFTLITTGTPVENHLGELWNLFDIILPGFLGSAAHFRDSFQLPIEKYENKQAKVRLKRLISPFILRRTKEEVLTELPPKTEINLTVELGEQESAFYEAVRQEAVDKLANPAKEDDMRFQVLAEITRLRQASLHPKLVDKTSPLKSAKIEVLTEKIEELIEGNHQALVFSQFTGFLKMIGKALDTAKIPYLYLDGSTPAKDRGDLVNQFQNGDRPVFLISLKAGGSGLNLTNADYVFHMDPWWNPAVEDQASDRAHRIGQERPVTVYRLIASGTIEEKIIGLHQEKRGLAEALLSDSAVSLKLDTRELIEIISKRS